MSSCFYSFLIDLIEFTSTKRDLGSSAKMSHDYQKVPDTYPLAHNETLVAGITVYGHYNEQRPNPFDVLVDQSRTSSLKVLYLLHGRQQSAKHTRLLANALLTLYYANPDVVTDPLIIFTFDQRNHGLRTIDGTRNLNWEEGNLYHGTDMLSIIDGTVSDLKNIIDYLPAYIPQLTHFKRLQIVSGVSMGGHITIRSVVQHPGLFDAAIPIVGSFDLSSLLLNRLHPFNRGQLFERSYDQIRGALDNELKFPQALFDKVSKDDRQIVQEYDYKVLKTLAIFGELDDVVVLDYSKSFLKGLGVTPTTSAHLDFKSHFQAIKYDAKHQVTDQMVSDITIWLINLD